MCRQTLRNEVPAAKNLALSCPPNRACKVNSFLRFSATLRSSAITDSLHQNAQTSPQPRTRRAFTRRVHAFLRVQHIGHRMLFIRFVNRVVQAVRRSRLEGRQQARDSGHSPFRGPARGRSPRARISNLFPPQHVGANPASIRRHLHSSYCAGFNRSRCVTFAPNPTWRSVSLTHIRCRMLASLRATAVMAHNMLDRLAIRRPHTRNADHFLTRSSRLAAASHSASRTATSPCLLIRPSKSIDVPDWCRLGVRPKWAPTVRDRAKR
ncbi:hypothetical protein V1279_001245 [Bradyrhizobium sp. AZCC 1610]